MSRELEGVRVVVTRSTRQASELLERLEEHGADAVALPLLEVLPPQDERALERAASELALYDWLVLTSANAVESLFERSGGTVPARLQIAVVGKATARALQAYEVEPAMTAEESRAEGLAAELAPHVRRRRRVLLPQAEDARPAAGGTTRGRGRRGRASDGVPQAGTRGHNRAGALSVRDQAVGLGDLHQPVDREQLRRDARKLVERRQTDARRGLDRAGHERGVAALRGGACSRGRLAVGGEPGRVDRRDGLATSRLASSANGVYHSLR